LGERDFDAAVLWHVGGEASGRGVGEKGGAWRKPEHKRF
jgi:hypothetical protein